MATTVVVAIEIGNPNQVRWNMVSIGKKKPTKREITEKVFKEAIVQSADKNGHPYVGYMDGDMFVPNKETIEAFSEREKMLADYYAEREA